MLIVESTLALLAAALLGAAVGFERQWRQRLAGLRTNALVSLGAATFALVGVLGDDVSPTRAAAQVASGIGFLGAGVILRDGLNVRGLNTAATLWCSAGVGVLCGSGFVLVSAVAAAIVVLTNLSLRPLAQLLNRQPQGAASEVLHIYDVRARCRPEREAFVRALLLHGVQGSALHLETLDSRDLEGGAGVEIRASLRSEGQQHEVLERIVGRLSLEPAVSGAQWRAVTTVEDEAPPARGLLGG